MKSLLRSSLFLLILAFGIASCKSDSDSGTGPGTTTAVKAKTGSTFTYDSTSSESNTTGSLTYTIAADNLVVGNRAGVRMVKQAQDTAFMYMYNTDGSVSMFFPMEFGEMISGGGSWIKLPVKGGTGEFLTVIDTGLYDPESQLTMSIKITMQSTYLGASSVAVSGKSYPGQNVKLVMTMESNFLGNVTAENTITWVPEIGFYGKMLGTTGDPSAPTTHSETLTAFTLVK